MRKISTFILAIALFAGIIPAFSLTASAVVPVEERIISTATEIMPREALFREYKETRTYKRLEDAPAYIDVTRTYVIGREAIEFTGRCNMQHFEGTPNVKVDVTYAGTLCAYR